MNLFFKQIKGLLYYYIKLINPSMAENSKKVSIEERFEQLQNTSVISEIGSKAKIQRVAPHLVGDGRMHYEKHFTPKLMSLGPIHYGAPKLQLGEEYKKMWAAMFFRSTDQTPQFLFGKIAENVEALKELFAPDLFTGNRLFLKYSEQGFSSMEEMICWTLLVDACALLQILEHFNLSRPEEMNVKFERLMLVFQDVMLLENQLPYPLLKLLWGETNEVRLIQTMIQFVGRAAWFVQSRYGSLEAPTHLLHLHRSLILYHKHGIRLRNTEYDTTNEDLCLITHRYEDILFWIKYIFVSQIFIVKIGISSSSSKF